MENLSQSKRTIRHKRERKDDHLTNQVKHKVRVNLK